MTRNGRDDAAWVLAEAVRVACIETAVFAYEDAGLQGLCQEGRWEHAVAALRRLDLRPLIDGMPLRGDEGLLRARQAR